MEVHMSRTVKGNKVTLKPDDGKIIIDSRNEHEYSVVVCALKSEKYFDEKEYESEEE